MAAFPSYARLLLSGAGVQASPVVARSDMERGVARTRRIATDPVMTINATIFFTTNADSAAFEDWFFSAAGGAGGAAWVDWVDPRSSTTRSIRIVSLGTLSAVTSRYAVSQQPCVLEYVRRTT